MTSSGMIIGWLGISYPGSRYMKIETDTFVDEVNADEVNAEMRKLLLLLFESHD